jgi:hypothetical protein
MSTITLHTPVNQARGAGEEQWPGSTEFNAFAIGVQNKTLPRRRPKFVRDKTTMAPTTRKRAFLSKLKTRK